MKILIIGHSIIDNFESLSGDKKFPGGIFYSLLGFLSAKSETDKIYLLSVIDDRHFNLFRPLYEKADLSFMIKVDAMPEVVLQISSNEEREEIYKNISGRLNTNLVSDWNQFDGILINMITGFDISLDQLSDIRKNFGGPIYLDIHTLSRGVGPDMKRNFRLIENGLDWAANVDLLQCNVNELKTICRADTDSGIIRKVIDSGTKFLIVTKGIRGAEVFYKEGGIIKSITAEPEKIYYENSVGCGDIFGAVFYYSYLCGINIQNSLQISVKAAAKAASIKLSVNFSRYMNDRS